MFLITGAAGFIGFHVAQTLLQQGEEVLGIDNLNDYYDTALKDVRLNILKNHEKFTFQKADVADENVILNLERMDEITHIIHLAAQAGVRYSIDNPFSYAHSNLQGHMVILELARTLHDKGSLKHFIYASSSSVYGGNEKVPFTEDDPVENPVSLYAASKRSCELLTQSYANLYGIPSTGLRFFTVYGPYGRPDMAYFSFTQKILNGESIEVFNHGNMKRDFTYIDDIVEGVLAITHTPPISQNPSHTVFNLGNNTPEHLGDFIAEIEKATGKTANKIMKPMALGDVEQTYADISKAKNTFGFEPKTPISVGIPKFVEWYKNFYQEGQKI